MEPTIQQKKPSTDLSKWSDLELIAAILETGDSNYFGLLYDRYADKVYGKCIQMVRDKTIAQDLAQDILVKAFLKLNTFQGKSNFGTWLYQVSYTHCIDYIRKNKNIYKEELQEERFDQVEDDTLEYEEIHDKVLLEMKMEYVQQILLELKAEDRMLLLQKYQDNVKIADLSESLGLSESAIKMKLKRLRDKVRDRYFELNPENL